MEQRAKDFESAAFDKDELADASGTVLSLVRARVPGHHDGPGARGQQLGCDLFHVGCVTSVGRTDDGDLCLGRSECGGGDLRVGKAPIVHRFEAARSEEVPSVVRASEKLPSRSQVGKEDLGPLVSMCPSVGINYVAQLL